MRKKNLFIVSEVEENPPLEYFRPCGAMEEFLDDPLEELMNEFSEFESEYVSAITPQTNLDLKSLIEEVEREMPSGDLLSPIEKLRLSMVKLKKRHQKLKYYIDEINLYMDG